MREQGCLGTDRSKFLYFYRDGSQGSSATPDGTQPGMLVLLTK